MIARQHMTLTNSMAKGTTLGPRQKATSAWQARVEARSKVEGGENRYKLALELCEKASKWTSYDFLCENDAKSNSSFSQPRERTKSPEKASGLG